MASLDLESGPVECKCKECTEYATRWDCCTLCQDLHPFEQDTSGDERVK